jgi:hypothetical protein
MLGRSHFTSLPVLLKNNNRSFKAKTVPGSTGKEAARISGCRPGWQLCLRRLPYLLVPPRHRHGRSMESGHHFFHWRGAGAAARLGMSNPASATHAPPYFGNHLADGPLPFFPLTYASLNLVLNKPGRSGWNKTAGGLLTIGGHVAVEVHGESFQ